ncbi:MAG TPA: serine/threonine-protein kinase [Solirubrobacteraceae bacterium]|jgi:serine/threonine-protein kinase|nr:serine/threonine-protein kinase [Solirubrobacteraceae bacterium]
MKIQLKREWEIGEQIDAGGFGSVRLATSDGENAVAKFVPKAPGTTRELLFVDLESTRNVVPIIDYGETEDSWVLVMPRAETNLRRYIDYEGPALSSDAVRLVLIDVVTTLVDLDGKVVHRDIKPENVLLLNGRWCLADFGISRYAEATTAPDTHKFAMSPRYGAPERWRNERATTASDVYAIGVMGYEMLSGSLPFAGPHVEDFRDQHLHSDPASLSEIDAGFASLVEECLIKAPGARPGPANLLARLERASTPLSSRGLTRLQEANRVHANQDAERARQVSQASSEQERRTMLFDAAVHSVTALVNTLVETIGSAAPTSTLTHLQDGAPSVKLGPAELRVFSPQQHIDTSDAGHRIPFDVVAFAAIGVAMPSDRYGYQGRSHSLCGTATRRKQRSTHGMRPPLCVSPLWPNKRIVTLSRSLRVMRPSKPSGLEWALTKWRGRSRVLTRTVSTISLAAGQNG